VLGLERLHERCERLHARQRHRVVDARAHAADAAVALELQQLRRSRLCWCDVLRAMRVACVGVLACVRGWRVWAVSLAVCGCGRCARHDNAWCVARTLPQHTPTAPTHPTHPR
jgi:hypothetical protein